MTPNFEAQYTAYPAPAWRPSTDETLTKDAPDCRCGIQALVMLKRPFRLVFSSLSQYSSVISSVGREVGLMPAQLKTWSIRPCVLMVLVMNSLH